MRIEPMTREDFLLVLDDLVPFWGSDRTRAQHLPPMFHELGDTALAARVDDRLVGYLMGFVSQRRPVGYVHLVAVREGHRGAGVARGLYARFAEVVAARGATGLAAITSPGNRASIAFHRAMGFTDGVVADHAGRGQDRVVFRGPIDLAPSQGVR